MNGARRCAATAGSLLSRRSGKIFHRSDRWTMTRGGRSRRVDSWGFGNIGTESPVKPSSATIAALSEFRRFGAVTVVAQPVVSLYHWLAGRARFEAYVVEHRR
jgi:hypothetical protein